MFISLLVLSLVKEKAGNLKLYYGEYYFIKTFREQFEKGIDCSKPKIS